MVKADGCGELRCSVNLVGSGSFIPQTATGTGLPGLAGIVRRKKRFRQKLPKKLLGPITEIVICTFVERANTYSYKMAARSSVKVLFSGTQHVGEYDIEGTMSLCSLMERAN